MTGQSLFCDERTVYKSYCSDSSFVKRFFVAWKFKCTKRFIKTRVSEPFFFRRLRPRSLKIKWLRLRLQVNFKTVNYDFITTISQIFFLIFLGCSATNQGLIVQKIIAEGKSKLFFRSIIVKNPEFFDGAGAGVGAGVGAGAGAENSIIFRLRLQQKSTAPAPAPQHWFWDK